MSKTAIPKPVKKQRQQDLAIVATSSRSLEHSGPLPPASEMAQYEKICPDAAERIIIMAEKQSENRQKIEYAVVRVSIKKAFYILGVESAFFIAITTIVLCGYCIYLGI